MKTDKEIKKEFKKTASQNPDDFYPTSALKDKGFMRKQCDCGLFFWTTHVGRKICGDPACSGGFDLVSNNPVKNKLSYIQVWKKIVEILKPRGYTPINRYPVIARWNPTAEFTMASIAAFQPYVISGEVKPPAKKLLIPQLSLRFGDIDNVGITGSHLTGFVMIGQHQFVPEEEWSQDQAFLDIYEFITEGIGLSKQEITIHEDAWAGGGNFGPCMEFFSRGVEIFNQVYMMFEQTPDGNKPLKIKVLDMGLGMERLAWFSQGVPNIYEATFPYVLKNLKKQTNIKMDIELYNRFSKYSAYLNIDEVDDINKAWQDVAEKLNISSADSLKMKILPMTGLYSIAEHTRTLLFAINDGGLPSNVGGGYNLRTILRRALEFIDKFNWNIDLNDVIDWHAQELFELFPELSENLEDIHKVINSEKKKYINSKKNAKNLIRRIIDKDINEKMLLELYDSNGINPNTIKQEADILGKDIIIPDDFYSKVSELHEKKENIYSTKPESQLNLENIPETIIKYYDDHKTLEFESKIIKIIDDNIILESTYFYPTSGGQLHDFGTINNIKLTDIFKQKNIIIHKLETKDHNLKEADTVTCKINKETRIQLTQHHTATHIINAAAKKILGNHIYQAGARKTPIKATLDLTHYDSLTKQETDQIENFANDIVHKNIPINKYFISRNEAEKKFGMSIYQGGAVPGNKLRIVDIVGVDVEACGGTHLDNTSEVENIKITKTSKIQDGIIRIEFVAGNAALKESSKNDSIIQELTNILDVNENQLVSATQHLFTNWKKIKKAIKKKKDINPEDYKIIPEEHESSDILSELCNILKTQPEHLIKTVEKFKSELDKNLKK